ncbi:MAG: cytochrome c biogenesis protein ResB [Myxococcota bacterium]
MLAALVAVSALVPQGWHAVRLAAFDGSPLLRQLHAWGLTDVASSPWLYALLVLLVGNLVAVALRAYFARPRILEEDRFLAEAPHRERLETSAPEQAVARVRATFGSLFGRPVEEKVDGARVVLAYESAPRAALSPLVAHVGLVVLMLGTVLATRPAPFAKSMVRARLMVTDTQGGSVGRFDMAQDEVLTFFQWPSEFSIRGYTPQKDGLGPAIRMERVDPERRRVDVFWIYRDAPPGFDGRHRVGLDGGPEQRTGQVVIEATDMGMVPRPGEGLASQPEAVLLLLGLGLLALGIVELSRPDGRVLAVVEGRHIDIAGTARDGDPRRFGAAFDRWVGGVRWMLDG